MTTEEQGEVYLTPISYADDLILNVLNEINEKLAKQNKINDNLISLVGNLLSERSQWELDSILAQVERHQEGKPTS